MVTSPKYFRNLDALRFLAFWGVFTAHVFPPPPGIEDSILAEIGYSVFSFPFFGVPFFFTLSSFLITTQALREYQATGRFNPGFYLIRRTLRIWPLYFLTLALIFLALPLLTSLVGKAQPTLPAWEPFVFFYSNFYIIQHGGNFVAALLIFWSLAVEEQFYLIWGFVLKFLKKYLSACIVSFFLFSFAFSCYEYYFRGKNFDILSIHTISIFQYLMTGALIAWVISSQNSLYHWLKQRRQFFYSAIYMCLFLLLGLPSKHQLPISPVFQMALTAIIFALILFDQTSSDEPLINAGRFAAINYLGKISYGLYIYHTLVFIIIGDIIPQNSNYDFSRKVTIFLLTLAITILVAHVSYQYYEKKFLNLKRKWQSRINA